MGRPGIRLLFHTLALSKPVTQPLRLVLFFSLTVQCHLQAVLRSPVNPCFISSCYRVHIYQCESFPYIVACLLSTWLILTFLASWCLIVSQHLPSIQITLQNSVGTGYVLLWCFGLGFFFILKHSCRDDKKVKKYVAQVSKLLLLLHTR